MLIAFTNTKGGVGKSTLAAHLAIWLWDRGYRVALLDTDNQQTSARWIHAAEPEITVVTATEMEEIQEARMKLLQGDSVIVADTPGKESDAARTVTFLADVAIVPLQPSKPDLRAIKDALKGIRLAQEVTNGQRPKATLVLNLTAKGDVQTRTLRRQLEASGFPIARSEIRRLNAIRDACDTAVTRLRKSEAGEAASDLDTLFMEVLGDILNTLPKRSDECVTIGRAANE
jgi:chromosome partitioning protein